MDNSNDAGYRQDKGLDRDISDGQFDSQYPQFGKAIKPLKVGDVAEPIDDDIGIPPHRRPIGREH